MLTGGRWGPVRRMAAELDERWPRCEATVRAGSRKLRCEALRGHSGSHVADRDGAPAFWLSPIEERREG